MRTPLLVAVGLLSACDLVPDAKSAAEHVITGCQLLAKLPETDDETEQQAREVCDVLLLGDQE